MPTTTAAPALASAASRLAEAFSTIIELSDYLPVSLVNDIGDGLVSWTGGGSWDRDPKLCRQILPFMIERAIRESAGNRVRR